MNCSQPSKYASMDAVKILHMYFLKIRLTVLATFIIIIIALTFTLNILFLPGYNFYVTFLIYTITLFIIAFIAKFINFNRFCKLSYILFIDCDPLKYQAVIAGLMLKDKKHKSQATLSLEYAKCCYYLDEIDEMYTWLQKVVFRKKNTMREIQKLNLYANFFWAKSDFESLKMVRSDTSVLGNMIKAKSIDSKNLKELLTVIDAKMLLLNGQKEQAQEKINYLLKISNYPIQRVYWTFQLAKLKLKSGENDTAITLFNNAASSGGTTIMAVESKRLLNTLVH